MVIWNPWHGCHKISEGCKHCYMFRRDAKYGIDSETVRRIRSYYLPLRINPKGDYVLDTEETVYVCMTSDFFIEEADPWREETWQMMQHRDDLRYYIITKRIDRFQCSLHSSWREGYEHVTIAVTCENQRMADERLPIFLKQPIKHRQIIHEPLLGPIDIRRYLETGKIEGVICGGESGYHGRICDFDWVLDIARQCEEQDVDFCFKQTGELFRKDGTVYRVPRYLQMEQARKAGLNTGRFRRGLEKV